MRIHIGADHAGFALKRSVGEHLVAAGHEVVDVGTFDEAAVDYPDYAELVARAVASGQADFGVLVCGTGLGMAMAANKVPGVRAAQAADPEFARMAREHNDANVLTLAGRYTDADTAMRVVDTFLATGFAGDADDGERHRRRVGKMAAMDGAG